MSYQNNLCHITRSIHLYPCTARVQVLFQAVIQSLNQLHILFSIPDCHSYIIFIQARIIAAISYGLNPLGALYLYEDGFTVSSVLFYRYSIAVVGLIIMMFLKREPFSISRREFGIVALLGILFAISSITLYSSFLHMEAGIACTILFVYPIMVAMIMSIFFKERVRLTTILSIALALSGIVLLYQGDGNTTLSTWGVILVLLSSLSYAIYIVIVNQAQLKMSAVKLTLYVMIIGAATVALNSFINPGCGALQPITTTTQLGFSLMLGIVPTLISLVTMAIAVRLIGSTPTAIMGSLEPVTAVAIGTIVFDEHLTSRLLIGIAMILSAVIIIIVSNTKKSTK